VHTNGLKKGKVYVRPDGDEILVLEDIDQKAFAEEYFSTLS